MVSRGCPVTTQHTPPKPPARKFFEPEVLLVCFFGPSTTFCSAIDSAMLTARHELEESGLGTILYEEPALSPTLNSSVTLL